MGSLLVFLGIGFVSSSPIKPEYGTGDEPKPYGCLPVRHCRVVIGGTECAASEFLVFQLPENGGVLCCTLNIDSDLTTQKGFFASFSWTKPCYSKDKGWYQKEECEEEEEEEEEE